MLLLLRGAGGGGRLGRRGGGLEVEEAGGQQAASPQPGAGVGAGGEEGVRESGEREVEAHAEL